MFKKLFVLGIVLAGCIGFSTSIVAANNVTVTLTANDTIEYSDANVISGVSYLGDAFNGLAPGETATQVITISNQNSHAAAFYVGASTLRALEQANNAAGGAYEVKLSVGNTLETAKNIMETIAGGYNSSSIASTKGLADIDELTDYTFIADLDAKETTNLYFTLTLEGEGMDSTASSDYSNSLAQIGFNFRAYYQDLPQPEQIIETIIEQGETKVVTTKGESTTVTTYVTDNTSTVTRTGTTIVDEGVPLAGADTGDETKITILAVVFILGLGLIGFTQIRRKKVKYDDKN